MSGTSRGHADPSLQPARPSEMADVTRVPTRLLEEPLPPEPDNRTFQSDHEAVAIRGPEHGRAKVDKRSLDYILRTGLAGGLAGCAVRAGGDRCREEHADLLTGQDHCRTSRPRQDPLPSLQSPICEIHWQLVRRIKCHARYQQSRWDKRFVPRPLSYSAAHLPIRGHQVPGIRTNTRRDYPVERE